MAPSSVVQICLFALDQVVGAVQGNAAVVTDDAAAAVGVGQTGEQTGVAGGAHPLGVGVEYALIVGLAVFAEVTLDLGIQLIAVGVQALLGHADAAVQVDHPLEGGIGLQADDDLVFLINVARGKVVRCR